MSTTTPMVSFVVPCYNLARFLPECLDSILSQSYTEFEVLIMDDCSPDDTPIVAARYLSDPRVRYIRNDTNLGHLRNYNKGIGLSRGRYVWLISADDRLRRPYVLERYIRLMERHPEVGYVFCPAIGIEEGRETGLLPQFFYGNQDTIFKRSRFALTLVGSGGGIASPSAMARKDCYTKLGFFPLDMPHLADLYLWCMWALQYDVAYVAEPMVNYRLHDASMLRSFREKRPHVIVSDDITLLWRLEEQFRLAGRPRLARTCRRLIAARYAYYLGPKAKGEPNYTTTAQQFEHCLHCHVPLEAERQWLRAHVYAGLGDRFYQRGEFGTSREYYAQALTLDLWLFPVWIKYLLIAIGNPGIRVRATLANVRQIVVQALGAS